MGAVLAWSLLLGPLLLLLQRLWGHELSCAVFPEDLDWSHEFNGSCLNLSGHVLRLPLDQPLRARNLQLLDLSGTGLRELPSPFLAPLRQLQVLSILHNRLDSLDTALATRCGLDLRADCGCVLGPWHRVWSDNCSGQEPPRCLHPATGTWQNLSTFLELSCVPGLSPGAIAGVVVGSVLLLAFVVASALLVWRCYGHRSANIQGPGKGWAPHEGSRPSSGVQPRYSSRGPSLKVPRVTLPGTTAPDYENIFVGGLTQLDHGAHLSEEGDFYMNYGGPSLDVQPVYGNLQASEQDDEYEISQH
ncbi:leucine-rich repeat-containing protein 25 [Fukomys damarensis]|uniref:Leucine-rich repeat-containing protein 25 n=1 Tax=Fukomys damarensis TaxID=885580 RepID=A0A091CT75_FUKDA|nr:leucine-rich repeat-containing protein 25 [Fukomys damarensis]XP_033615378.1 leucine-rich repeat-containing protein 25 [Fukomys damarensis]KFO22599.1 Leucine-rich repeat-containing protein 25 [Fukomys damarensis]